MSSKGMFELSTKAIITSQSACVVMCFCIEDSNVEIFGFYLKFRLYGELLLHHNNNNNNNKL